MGKQPENQCCEDCRYGDPDEGQPSNLLYCTRHPPRPSQLGDESELADYPLVDRYWWCGEYAPANPETVTEGAATLARLVLLGDLTAARTLADQLRE